MRKIKQIAKKILYTIGCISSKIYTYNMHQRMLSFSEIIYSGWCSSGFAVVQKDFKIGHNAYIRGQKMIYIHNNVYIGENVVMTVRKTKEDLSEPRIEIGAHSMLGSNCHLTAINGIIIGENLRTGRNVLISDNSHGKPGDSSQLVMHPNKRPLYSKGGIIINKNVWIGDNAVILGGVTIGDGAIIGANAVVTHNVPAGKIAIGCPAKII